MGNKGVSNFFLIIIALIIGKALYNQFDYQNLKFEKPALSILYIIVFVASIYFIIRNFTNRPTNQ